MKPDGMSRLDFLKVVQGVFLAACGLLGMGGLIRFLSAETEEEPRTDFDLGPEGTFQAGEQVLRMEIPAAVSRDDNGWHAFSLVCTHLGCTLEMREGGFTCPCHGSRFDQKGEVLRGPAARRLESLRVEITSDGHLHVLKD